VGGRIFVLSGPSGVGKSTIIREVRNRLEDLAFSISHTTRGPRDNERDGVEYYFVDVPTFRGMIDGGEFAEWAEVYGDFYGTSRAQIRQTTGRGRDVITDLDVQGALSLKRSVDESVLIFVLPPSLEALETRLRERGKDDPETIAKRIRKAEKEMESCPGYDFLVFNDRLETAVEEVAAIIRADRCRTARRIPELPFSTHCDEEKEE